MGKFNPYSYCFRTADFYKKFNTRKLKIKKNVCLKTYGCHLRNDFCVKVFLLLMCLIILDIIENNITFVVPLKNNKDAFISVKPIIGKELQHIKQVGGMVGIDLLCSNFVGYHMFYQYRIKDGTLKYKPMYISKDLKKMFYDNINKGKVYY